MLSALGDPDLILLDEPYQGFDQGTYLDFWERVWQWRDEGKAIVVVTHLLEHLERVDSVLDLAIEGPVLVRSASFLTERGLLTLHCYEAEDRAPEMLPVFEAIIDSVHIAESIAYRPRLGDRWSSTHTAVTLFVLAGIFAAFGLAGRRRNRPRSTAPGASLQSARVDRDRPLLAAHRGRRGRPRRRR